MSSGPADEHGAEAGGGAEGERVTRSGGVGQGADDRGAEQPAVSRQDRTISPELQRFMAGRMEATTVEIDAGHLSLLSHPEEATQLIMNAVQAVRPGVAP